MDTNKLNDRSNEQQPLPIQENKDLPTDHLLENSKSQKEKNKKKHHSLTAAALSRSAVGHAKSHTISNKPGDFAHSGTNISYDN